MRLRIRDGKTLAVQRELRVHDAAVNTVAWNPKMALLATASQDYSVKIWDLTTDKLVEEFWLLDAVPERLFWSPDGTQLGVRSWSWGGRVAIYRPKVCQEPTE